MRNPQVEDITGDGVKDLIAVSNNSEENPTPTINYWKREANGSIGTTNIFQANGQSIYGTGVAAADWNSDGKSDLIVNNNKSLKLYLNNGTTAQHSFTNYTELQAEGIKISYDSAYLQVYDLNNDGKKDLIVGVKGGIENKIYYFENTGTSTAPALKKGVILVTQDNKAIQPKVIKSMFFAVADLNGDGAGDILLLDREPNGSIMFDVVCRLYTNQSITGSIKKSVITKSAPVSFTWNSQNSKLKLQISSGKQESIAITILSTQGRVIRKYIKNISSVSEVSLNLENLVSGVYLVKYSYDFHDYSNKIIVNK